MEDFNDYVKRPESEGGDMFRLVGSLARKFDGKNAGELLSAIYAEAKKGKAAGTLSNAEIDAFNAAISPFLDGKKKKYLDKITAELKKL